MGTDTASRILEVMRDLTVRHGVLPSMDAVAKSSGVSKGGLIHHFPTRSRLLRALVDHLARRCESDFEAARGRSSAGRTWLETSTPESDGLASMFVLFTALQALNAAGEPAGDLLEEFTRRTQSEIADEVGGRMPALVLRLVGDGLLLNALSGTPLPRADRDELIARLAIA